mmetsp:Transcript_37901/g.62467  ORF Transcript_37901/g.62467 Transcript_37901/m.62467 type:complete len:118 (-) Transcript_37901:1698-2051(-)
MAGRMFKPTMGYILKTQSQAKQQEYNTKHNQIIDGNSKTPLEAVREVCKQGVLVIDGFTYFAFCNCHQPDEGWMRQHLLTAQEMLEQGLKCGIQSRNYVAMVHNCAQDQLPLLHKRF